MKRRLKGISGFEKKFEAGKSEMIQARSLNKGPFKPSDPQREFHHQQIGWGGRIRKMPFHANM